jgi:hypothetical protein
MMNLTLVVLAAGLSTRYGRLKQLEPVGPSGEALLDYGVYDALRAGFKEIVLVTRPEIEDALREHLSEIFGPELSAAFPHQELQAIPDGYRAPEGRTKPWGTGHAVLAAEPAVHTPFVVMNADDFYGAGAFARLAEHLRDAAPGQPDFAAAGYALQYTLSPHGGVSRAVCDLDSHGYLRRVTEVKNVRRQDGVIAGVTLAGERLELGGDETISMNLWAAAAAAFPLLKHQFTRFLRGHGHDLEAEFFLSEAVNDLIAGGEARVRVLPVPGPWLGMTHPEDKPHVETRLAELVASGEYPSRLSLV